MRPISLKWLYLTLFSLIISINSLRAALFNQNSSDTIRHKDGHLLSYNYNLSEAKTLEYKRFIILTTGHQIKLYPLTKRQLSVSPSISDGDIIANQHYLIQPREILNENPLDTIHRLGDNPLSRWVISRSTQIHQNSRGKQQRKPSAKSIIPAHQASGDEDYYADASSDSGWKKPLIVDVDYFFDSDFCDRDEERQSAHIQCLVIVWLDKRNKFVRYGSFNLSKHHLEQQNSNLSLAGKNKVLWLKEFPPIELVEPSDSQTMKPVDIEVYSMALDRRHKLLHVALGGGAQSHPNRIVSIKLSSNPSIDPDYLKTVRRFNQHCFSQQVHGGLFTFDNPNIDPDNNDWLFYLDRGQTSSNIVALNVYQNLSQRSEAPQQLIQTSVRNIQSSEEDLNDRATTGAATNKGAQGTPLGIAMDSQRRRLYWLTSANELYECNYAGQETRLIGKLSHKPIIRSAQSMQVLDGILYLSDPIKKSLIAYKIDRKEDAQKQTSDQETKGQNSKIDDTNLIPTHEVLLVEMPSLYGFHLIDLDNSYSSHLNASKIYLATQVASRHQIHNLINGISSERTTFGKIESYIRKLFASWVQSSGEYDHLLDRYVAQESSCARNWSEHYSVSDVGQRQICASLSLLHLLIIILNVVALSLTFLYLPKFLRLFGRSQRKSDKELIIEKCYN